MGSSRIVSEIKANKPTTFVKNQREVASIWVQVRQFHVEDVIKIIQTDEFAFFLPCAAAVL